jgi:DNA-directed RNA polymerase alpha subunit
MKKEMTFKHISIDQLKFDAIVFNCPERLDVHTISYLLSYSQDDLIKNFKKYKEIC